MIDDIPTYQMHCWCHFKSSFFNLGLLLTIWYQCQPGMLVL